MKTLKLAVLFTIFCASLYLFGCKGDNGVTGPTGPTGPPGPSYSGKMTGLVTLTDSNGAQPTNKSGVTVAIENSTKSAVTDSTGKWSIDSVSTGVYTIDISKNTYGMSKIENYQFVGVGTTYLGNTLLSETPNFTVSVLTYVSGNGYVDVSGTLTLGTPQTTGRNILLFIGNSNSVSSSTSTYLGVVSAFANGVAVSFTQRITTATFTNLGIGTGSPAFIIAYTASATAGSCSRYLDQATGRFVYTSLSTSASNVLQVVTPEKPSGISGNQQ
jgi:hypothetical protein